MDNILIRQAEEKDLAAILDLVRDLAIYEKAEDQLTAILEDYKKNFKEGVFEAIVAEQEGKVVGMALYYLTWSTWRGRMLYLEDFVVKEHLRGAGFGNKLFDATVQRAKDLDCFLMKWQVLDWNTPAVKFYEKKEAIIEKEWWNGKIFLKPV
ncbi:MAG: GNAT family N-acetyltransferase [Saprospiraceae bacterium]